MRLPLRMALSHHAGPRRLISLSSSAPGNDALIGRPPCLIVGIRDSAGIAGAGAADFDKDCAHDAKLMTRSKQAIQSPSRVQIHIRLTMWIIGANAPCFAKTRESENARHRSRSAAGCCNSDTVARIFRRAARRHETYDRMTSATHPCGDPRADAGRSAHHRTRSRRARLLCAARRACDRSGRAASCAAGSISASPRPVHRPRYRRAPFPASCGSAA